MTYSLPSNSGWTGTCFVDLPNADAFEAALALHQSNFDVAADGSARRAVNVRPVYLPCCDANVSAYGCVYN